MTGWTADEVRAALELDAGGETAAFTRVLTDTRAIEPDALFVALAGDRFDGHDYQEAAAASGASIGKCAKPR